MSSLLFPFDKTPEQIRDWILSDTVDGIIQELFTRHPTLKSPQRRAIPQIITAIPLRLIKPEQFFPTLTERFKFPALIADDITKTVKARIFDPIKTSMLEVYGINTDDILKKPTSATARTMPIEKPVIKPPVAVPTQTPRPVGPPPPPVPKARVMEMSQVIDVRKPVTTAATTKATAPSVAKQTSPTPTAQTMKIEGDFSAGGPAKAVAPAPKPAGPVVASKPAGESDVLETKKEFGLAEAVPKPPQPQEIEKYEDHHPVVE